MREGMQPARERIVVPLVLLAEDNLVNQKVAVKMLERLGCRVLVASTGIAAVAAIASHPVDLVLMDCQMPEMDGFEAARRVRASGTENRAVPIIALTANAMMGDRERCIEAGMNDYLTKPVMSADLKAMVERHLPRFRAESPDARTDSRRKAARSISARTGAPGP
jgi:CheY-like chemotaxis protein